MKKIRNIAIIAHVDHGKTTLVDQLLKRSGTFRTNEQIEERAMDSNDLERERGITILAKTTSLQYKDYKINILDTPGHADFGGEVERIMNLVDGVLLVVDAYEGTMPQTRFVLKKALEAGVKPIVLINKVDRPFVRLDEVLDEVLELFIELGATDEQIDFPVVYTSGLMGTSSLNKSLETQKESFDDLFDLIINEIDEPSGSIESPLQMQPALLDYNDFVGRIGIGKLYNGKIKVNEMVSCVRTDGSKKEFRVQKLFGYKGLKRVEVEEAYAGDIVAIAGLADISVGETICTVGAEKPLPLLRIDEPTLQMMFAVNNSPFSGKEGKYVTARKLEERLYKASESDVSLKIEKDTNDSWIVSGRGELHLSILIENLRRESYELQVSKPEVIIKEINGVQCEPYEELQVEVDEESLGYVIEAIGKRAGTLNNMSTFGELTRLLYTIPSRGLIGFTTEFLTLTKGYGIINHSFKDYLPITNIAVGERKLGVLVSMENGKSNAYGIGQLEDRGIMFIDAGVDVYEGMIVGEHNRDNDLAVNVTKTKQLTNMRAAGSDKKIILKKPRIMTLEMCLDYINSDELVEITPQNIRLRKKILNANERKKYDNRKNN